MEVPDASEEVMEDDDEGGATVLEEPRGEPRGTGGFVLEGGVRVGEGSGEWGNVTGEVSDGEGGGGRLVVRVARGGGCWQRADRGEEEVEVVLDFESVVFVVGAVGMAETGGAHGGPTSVPGVGNLGRIGGEGSEDVGRGVGGDVPLERGG